MASSLPPLLLQRLQRRGILPDNQEEEIFAESYDQEDESKEDVMREKYRGGAPGCPNKYIPYHVCTDFCFDHWMEGYPESRLSERYNEQRRKMLRNYPLPEGWDEIYDPGMRRHYYWNRITDEVCWLSPKHPKAIISEAAPKIAKEMLGLGSSSRGVLQMDETHPNKDGDRRYKGEERKEREKYREKRNERRDRREAALVKRNRDEDDSDEDERPIKELSEYDKLKRARRRGIDPMDPSAYGEAPEGSWTSGLAIDQEVKTGVDTTASGPLFQQRPYPAPGAILRKMHPDKYPPQ